MFSWLFAHAQRILVTFWVSVMVFVVSLPPHSSLFLRRRDQPRDGQMRPIRVTRTPEATHVRPGCDPHEVKLLRNHPRLIRLVAYNVIHIARYWPRHGERRCKDDNELESSQQLRLRPYDDPHFRQHPDQQ